MRHINSLIRSKLSSLFLSLAIIVCFTAAARAQSALDGFDPNANSVVQIVVVQPDGKILIGGDFTIVQGISRNRIARLNPDGTLDQLFDPNSSGYVNTIAVQADGKILVGGGFNGANSIGGQTRNRIARLDAVTGLADSFDPNASGGSFTQSVFSIVVQTDGKILVGGGFSNIGGQARNRIARLDAVTGLADSFDPAPTGFQVQAIALQADGKILVAGILGIIGGQTRTRIARLDPVTGLADSWNPNASGMAAIPTVSCIAVQADGKVLAGGIFNTIGGQTRNNIARLDGTTGLADSWDPNANNSVNSIAVQPDGKILAGGNFNVFYSPITIGGQARNGIARLDAVTGLADSFDPNAGGASGAVNSIALQQDGKILAGGNFTSMSPNGGSAVTRNYTARMETNGLLDRTLDLGIVGDQVFATAVQPDGKILIGGFFSSVFGVARSHIARLNTDGTLDTGFNPSANGLVLSIAVQVDGKILVGGSFTSIGGQSRNRVARLDATTGAADSFDPDADDTVYSITVQANGKVLVGGVFTSIGAQTRRGIARFDPISGAVDSFDLNANGGVLSIAVQADGKILVGGSFTSIGSQTRNRIARFNTDSTLDTAFNPNANGTVAVIALQADAKILACGGFNSIGGQTRNRIARLDATTGLADPFDPNANNGVNAIAVQADGKILAGGFFTTLSPNGGSSVTRNRIARFNPDGTVDSFNPNANSAVYSIAVQADGKVLVGGFFNGANSIGGQPRNIFARLSNDTVALQNLAVTQRNVTWTFGGSSPYLSRVTFESSTDGVNYNFLGNGTASGTNWTLTGLNLPTLQNIYIRARGFYRGGYFNGSESITESVRNAFLLPAIRGTVTYGNAAAPPKYVSNATVTGTGAPTVMTTTAAPGGTAGQYSLSGFGSGSYTVSLSKTTGQNSITSNDAARIAQHVAGSLLLTTDNQKVTADVSGNGVVSSNDAALIARYVASLGAPIGSTGQWRFYLPPGPTFPVGASPTSRTYASVTSSITGDDYVGLLIGEVTGNWAPGTARPADTRHSAVAIGSGPVKNIAVDLPQMAASTDKEVVIPVSVQGVADKEIISYEFDLRYDPSVIQPQADPINVAGTVSRGLSVVTNAEEPGLLRVVVYGAMPIDDNGVLLNLRFIAVGAPGSVSPLTFESMMFNEGEPRVRVTDGQVELSATELTEN